MPVFSLSLFGDFSHLVLSGRCARSEREAARLAAKFADARVALAARDGVSIWSCGLERVFFDSSLSRGAMSERGARTRRVGVALPETLPIVPEKGDSVWTLSRLSLRDIRVRRTSERARRYCIVGAQATERALRSRRGASSSAASDGARHARRLES